MSDGYWFNDQWELGYTQQYSLYLLIFVIGIEKGYRSSQRVGMFIFPWYVPPNTRDERTATGRTAGGRANSGNMTNRNTDYG